MSRALAGPKPTPGAAELLAVNEHLQGLTLELLEAADLSMLLDRLRNVADQLTVVFGMWNQAEDAREEAILSLAQALNPLLPEG